MEFEPVRTDVRSIGMSIVRIGTIIVHIRLAPGRVGTTHVRICPDVVRIFQEAVPIIVSIVPVIPRHKRTSMDIVRIGMGHVPMR